MNVLLIALGMMGQRYQRVLQQTFRENLNLVTVDPKWPTNPDEKHYSSLDEVPADLAFDLAIDARPNLGRLEMLQAFLTRRIPHIVIEKPSASSFAESQAMMALLDRADYTPRVFVPFYRRFCEAFQHETLSKLGAGPLKSIIISVGAVGMGCVGIHYIDMANDLFQSEPTDVYGQMALRTIPSPRGSQFMDDAGTLIANYPSGRFILHMLPDSSAGANITLLFERGKIQYLDQRAYEWHWFAQPLEMQEEPFYKTHQEVKCTPPFDYNFRMEESMAEGLKALVTGKPIPDLAAGHRAIKMLALAVHSSETGHAVAWENEAALQDVAFQFT